MGRIAVHSKWATYTRSSPKQNVTAPAVSLAKLDCRSPSRQPRVASTKSQPMIAATVRTDTKLPAVKLAATNKLAPSASDPPRRTTNMGEPKY